MILRLTAADIVKIREHAEKAYPFECCGIMLGHPDPTGKIVTEIVELSNEREDSRNNRFLITPETLLRADRDARSRKLEILGFYHSHPDAPARPSEFDREHAWPTYSYVIVSVVNGRSEQMNSWILSADRTHYETEAIQDAVEV